MFSLGDGNIYQARKLPNQFVALILYSAGIFSQALHLSDLAVELGNLAGEPVDLIHSLGNRLIQSRPDRLQAGHCLMKRIGKVVGGGQHSLAGVGIGGVG